MVHLFPWLKLPRPSRVISAGQRGKLDRWLHDLGVAHRDLSLENILLTEASGAERFQGAENVFIQMDGLRIYVVHMFVCVWRCMEYGSKK
jgi:serine/threonine protein kinase